MERKPHWDTDLEQSVSAILFDCYENGVSEEQVYQVIAAVEDWQNRRTTDRYAFTLGGIGGKYLPEWIAQSAIHRAEKAEAAIQRVREVCRATNEERLTLRPDWLFGWDWAVERVLRALDGGAE